MELNNREIKYERKLLFLCPNLIEYDDIEKSIKIQRLFSTLNYICKSANSYMTDMYESGFFTMADCIPKVEIRSVRNSCAEFDESGMNGVRVCITEYDGIRFDEYYEGYTEEQSREAHDISHLLSVHLFSDSDENSKLYPKAQWKVCDSGYDATIYTVVSQLKDQLCAIMLDIALYYYYQMPTDLRFRHIFGLIKAKYLEEDLSSVVMKKIYGSTKGERAKIKYLPVSLMLTNCSYEAVDTIEKLQLVFEKMLSSWVLDELVIDTTNKLISIKKPGIVSEKEINEAIENFLDERFRHLGHLVEQLSEGEEKQIIKEYTSYVENNEKVPLYLLLSERPVFSDGNDKRRFLISKDIVSHRYINLNKTYELLKIIDC